MPKEKAALGIEKLEAQIVNLKRPPLKKLVTWQVIVTALISIATISLLYTNGAFDIQKKTLEFREAELKDSIKKLDIAKAKLTSDTSQLVKNIDSLKDKANSLQGSVTALHLTANSLKKENKEITEARRLSDSAYEKKLADARDKDAHNSRTNFSAMEENKIFKRQVPEMFEQLKMAHDSMRKLKARHDIELDKLRDSITALKRK